MTENEINVLNAIKEHNLFVYEKNLSLIDFLTFSDEDEFTLGDIKFKKIQTEIVDKSRWSLHYEVVLKINEKLYVTYYSIGATESQCEEPYEYDRYIKFQPAKEVQIVSYEVIK